MFDNLPPLLQHFFFIVPAFFTTLFHVVNPIGSGVLFLNLTPDASNALRRQVARKVAVNSFIILLITLLIGVYILKLFGITIPIVQMCGGMMILTMGWRALQDDTTTESDKKKSETEAVLNNDYINKAFYPFTFPFTVGPGSIAVTLTISAESITSTRYNDALEYSAAIFAIILVCITVYLCYTSADYLISKISEQVRKVIMKILSFILLCIGGQIIFNGLTEFLKHLHKIGAM
jgi:multiple antibiotic resistance protein